MPTTADQVPGLKEFFDTFFADVNDRNRAVLSRYIQLEETVLKEYHARLNEELSVDNDILQSFTKTMMATSLQMAAFQRETKTRFLELQSSVAEVHLRFLKQAKESLSRVAGPGEAGDSSSAD